MEWKRKTVLFLASGFGLGLVTPFAPGTAGSLPGIALAYATSILPLWAEVATSVLLVLLAIPLCSSAEKILAIRDDGRIAADEWMLFPVAVLGIPVAALPWWAMGAFFLVTRAVDILKPPPARQLQCLPGGMGVVLDDLAANLYSLAINWTLYLCLFR